MDRPGERIELIKILLNAIDDWLMAFFPGTPLVNSLKVGHIGKQAISNAFGHNVHYRVFLMKTSTSHQIHIDMQIDAHILQCLPNQIINNIIFAVDFCAQFE